MQFGTEEEAREAIDRYTVMSCARGGMRWAIELAFNSGIARGMTEREQDGHFDGWFYPDFSQFKLNFYSTIGSTIYCQLLNPQNKSLFHDFSVNLDFKLFGMRDNTSADVRVAACAAFEQAVTTLLPKSTFVNHIAFCESPHPGTYARFCKNIGGHMVCGECEDRFMLADSNPHPVAAERDPRTIERAKLTASLRYSILLRDKFTCRGCGRSPSRGDEVKLHVDHILAIALGGKTVPENLQTLCADCNLGKSTSPWMDDPQLAMF